MALRAVLWEKDATREGWVRCRLCAHSCRVAEGASGRCRMRVNRQGILYSLCSDKISVVNIDPIEKKPLFHYLPGSSTCSLGTPGCNLLCAFCQNHELSQGEIPYFERIFDVFPPQTTADIIRRAKKTGAASIAFTYNEPTISVELIGALAPAACDAHMGTVLVSNAYIGKEGMAHLRSLIRAANFDIKAFNDHFYRRLCGAKLAPVLRTITEALSFGWWVELTTLLIPGLNDSDAEMTKLARFIKEDCGKDVPWHLSRFHPMFRLRHVPATPVETLERARAIGLAEGLHYVYTGNVPGHDGESTYCPCCGQRVIQRAGYRTQLPAKPCCSSCGASIPGVWGKTERNDL
ncbi:AmmeMemoRadiSam system radical SAM enzyme [Deltaproteobacteria bacterium]|nr:AmmeMemoRadiSam system radical SAM enzyme [Deltaproteobacteria bacterium]